MSSHDVERAVGAGQSMKRQYAHSQHKEKTAGVVGALLNGSRQDLREAAYEYEALIVNGTVVPSKSVRKTRSSWRNPGEQHPPRAPHMRFQNKEIVKGTVLAFGKRAEQVDDGVAHEAEMLAKKNIDSGVDRTSRKEAVAAKRAEASAARLRKRKVKAAAAAERVEKAAASNIAPKAGSKPRKKIPTAESQAARALISNPARLYLGKFDLTAKISASNEELTEECEARGIAPANGAQLRAKPKGPEAKGDPKLTVKALVLLLKPHSDEQGLLSIISQTASGTGRFQRGDRVRPAPCKAPEPALPLRSEVRASEVAFSSTSVPAIPEPVAAAPANYYIADSRCR